MNILLLLLQSLMEETRYAARLCNSILPGLVGETMSVDTPIRPQKM